MDMKFWGVIATLVSFIAPVHAVDSLPSSGFTPEGVWRTMRASSFDGTVDNVIRQCEKNALDDAPLGQLTTSDCQRLEHMLRNGRCDRVMVPDGTVLDILNGRRDGKSQAWFGQVKELGQPTPALLCDLGEGLFAYWFTGERGKSCNNLAWVFPAPEVSAVLPAPVEQPVAPPPIVTSIEEMVQPRATLSAPPLQRYYFSDVVRSSYPRPFIGWGVGVGSHGRQCTHCGSTFFMGPGVVPGMGTGTSIMESRGYISTGEDFSNRPLN